MKKLLAFTLAFITTLAWAAPYDLEMNQYDQFGVGRIQRLMPLPSGGQSGVLIYDNVSTWPKIATVDSTLTISSSAVIGVSSSTLSGKFNTPTGTTSQYIRGDGSLATFPAIPSAYTFDFGYPSTRSLSMSTSYQALNTAKAAIVYPSFACTNTTTVLAASECTVAVRVGASALTCSTGTVLYTIRLAVSLGLLITQASTNPAPIPLPIGGNFIFCPVAGTFTIATAELTAG